MSHLLVRGGAALVAVALLLVPVAALAAESKSSERPPETRIVGVVNINTATPEQLGLLPGVGPVRAQAIIAQRKEAGGFKRIDDLKLVSGIGDRALERIRPHVSLDGKTTARLQR